MRLGRRRHQMRTIRELEAFNPSRVESSRVELLWASRRANSSDAKKVARVALMHVSRAAEKVQIESQLSSSSRDAPDSQSGLGIFVVVVVVVILALDFVSVGVGVR